VTLTNPLSSIPENTNLAEAIKLADVAISDDGVGTNALTLTGADASSFQIVGVALFLKAGTALSASSKPNYSVTVNVDDIAVGNSPDATVNFSLTITAAPGGAPSLIISEVSPWASGNSPLGADWFEVTNIGAAAANITGWKVDDSSNSFGSSIALSGVASIAPGESVIFIESSSSSIANTFKTLWFGANPPASLQVGSYSGAGIGLSTGGDAVNLYNSTGALQANVVFGSSPTGPTYATFDNGAGLNGTTITALSAIGIRGAFAATNNSAEIGSPGTIGAAAPVPAVPPLAVGIHMIALALAGGWRMSRRRAGHT
jgi:hypothetical protein